MRNISFTYRLIYFIQILFFLSGGVLFADGLAVDHLPKFKRKINSFYSTHLTDPQSIFLDLKNKEMFIVDALDSTVFIFDLKGTPISKLDRVNGISRPIDFVSRKNMYYISQSKKDYVEVFDILGNTVKKIKPDNRKFLPGKLYLGFDGRLYVINRLVNEILVFDADDKFVQAIGTGDSRLMSLSGAAIGYDRLYLFTPFTTGNAIHVYLLNGDYSHSFESLAGYGSGTLGLPVTGLVDSDKNLWLVDSLRGILVYNSEDKKINNFGQYEIQGVRKVLQFPIDIDFGMQNEVYILEKSLKQVSIFR